jgi:hypothetical protein
LITVSALSSPESLSASRGQRDYGRFVVDMGQRLAHERLGLVAGEAQPPAGFLERERGAHQEVTALARPRHRRGLLQVAERTARVAGRQLALGDTEQQLGACIGLGYEWDDSQQQLGRVFERE